MQSKVVANDKLSTESQGATPSIETPFVPIEQCRIDYAKTAWEEIKREIGTFKWSLYNLKYGLTGMAIINGPLQVMLLGEKAAYSLDRHSFGLYQGLNFKKFDLCFFGERPDQSYIYDPLAVKEVMENVDLVIAEKFDRFFASFDSDLMTPIQHKTFGLLMGFPKEAVENYAATFESNEIQNELHKHILRTNPLLL